MGSELALVITGPTASGKTGIAIEVAQAIGGEIISVDSRQVYQGMNIGTAKATPAERAAVPHHGLDLLTPAERYNAGRFAEDARAWIADIRQRGRVPILVGGTGFFLRALTHPMFSEPPLDAERKERLKQWLNRRPPEELLGWLGHLDPVGARRVDDETGRQRIARMIEVALLTGRPLHWWQQQPAEDEAPISTLTIVLTLDRDALYRRINQRVVDMVSAGLVQEVEALLARGYDEHTPGLKTTGYIELIPYVRGETTLAEAIDAIQRATRGYARRQITWFRHQLAEPVIEVDAARPRAEVVELILREWRQHNANRN
ncbi:MAG TPA: tRNA (adenosine(37)-N6)-dimethylallyltransferase MiaA [Longimicrobiales bacterium]